MLDRVEVRAQHRCGSITPFGSLVDPLVNCRIASRSRSSSTRSNASDLGRAAPGHEVGQQHGRRVAFGRLVERREIGIDQEESRVGVADARPRLVHELLERSHSHRQREHYGARAGDPARLDRSDERTAGRAEDRDVVAGLDATRLHAGADDARVVVQLRPRHEDAIVLRDERRSVPPIGGALDTSDQRSGRHGHKTCARQGRLRITPAESAPGQQGSASILGLHVRPS